MLGHNARLFPIFVHKNNRVAALIQVICLALLVFCLIERQVRAAPGGDGKMDAQG